MCFMWTKVRIKYLLIKRICFYFPNLAKFIEQNVGQLA